MPRPHLHVNKFPLVTRLKHLGRERENYDNCFIILTAMRGKIQIIDRKHFKSCYVSRRLRRGSKHNFEITAGLYFETISRILQADFLFIYGGGGGGEKRMN